MKRRAVIFVAVVAALVAAEAAFERIGAHAIVDAPNQSLGDGPLATRIVEPATPARATIFVLHGIRDRKESMTSWAERLRASGYRVVLVDSRGQGASPGKWLTYGVEESRDLSSLLTALHVDGPVGVMGMSYGAATAIEWAAREPRVAAAVAIAPFASLREVVPEYAPRLVPRFLLTRAIDEAGKLAAFDPDDANPRAAAHATTKPILIVHGRGDHNIPIRQSEEIADGARNVTLVELDGADHEHISGDERIWSPALDFFARAIK